MNHTHVKQLLGTLCLLGIGAGVWAAAAAPASEAAQIHQLMSKYHALGQLDGTVLVADHGKVVYQHAFGLANREWQVKNSTDTAYRIASLTKQFSATLVLQLAEQGKLRLDDTIGQYVPELRPEIGHTVTLHQLLNHTSGIVDYANYPGFWERRLGEKVPRADFIAIMNGELEFKPGTVGHYNSSGYALLGWVIEKASGKPFAEALDAMILAPLRMNRSGVELPERLVARKAAGYTCGLGACQPAAPLWVPNIGSGGGMYSTVGDFLKWDQALYSDRLLSKASKALMFTPYVKDDVWGDLGYGYGWMIGSRAIGGKARLVHEHGGNANGFRSLITRYPDEQRLVVIMLNEGNGNKGPGIYRIKDCITKVLYKEAAPEPKAELADLLVAAIERRGVPAALAGFDALRAQAAPLASPDVLNQLAYQYAGTRRYDAAIAVMQLNLRLYPADGNSHDTLGEVYLLKGEREQGIAHYRKALQMDPKNNNARDVLKKLGAE
jgi:CubicO group peptidase (beta-lactamase class C family)